MLGTITVSSSTVLVTLKRNMLLRVRFGGNCKKVQKEKNKSIKNEAARMERQKYASKVGS